MFTAFIAFALLTVTDPSVGPSAAESLTAPTSALYRNLAPFDLQEVSVLETESLELRLQLGSYANPLGLENGFSHPIIEVYVGDGEAGVTELLPGSGLILPEGESWRYAFQLTGDHITAFRAVDGASVEFTADLQVIDEYLYIMTAEPPIPEPRLAAVTGLYSPFHETGWRPLSQALSPWAFSSTEQTFPVIDVLALTDEAQQSALTGGVLPVTEVNTIENPNTLWFALMAAGIGLAGVGLIMRGFSPATRRSEPEALPTDAEAAPEVSDTGEATVADEPTEVEVPDVTVAETEAGSAEAVSDVDDADGERAGQVDSAPESAVPEPAVDDPEDDPESLPRVGVFRGADEGTEAASATDAPALPEQPADEPVSSDTEETGLEDYALPDHGSIDFGQFGPLQEAEAEPETEPDSEPAHADEEPVRKKDPADD